MNNYFSVNDSLSEEFGGVLTKCKGANVNSNYFKGELDKDVFSSFYNNGEAKWLHGVTEWRYLNE